jgi:starch-binding outer membrane protein, SusD/RagB family
LPSLSQGLFRQQLKHERIAELAGEDQRWDDFDCWSKLGPQLASRDAGFANFKMSRDKLLPFQQDINANPNRIYIRVINIIYYAFLCLNIHSFW